VAFLATCLTEIFRGSWRAMRSRCACSASSAKLPSFSACPATCPVFRSVQRSFRCAISGWKVRSDRPVLSTASQKYFKSPFWRLSTCQYFDLIDETVERARAAACHLKQPGEASRGQPMKTARWFMACSQDRDHIFGREYGECMRSPTRANVVFSAKSGTFAQARRRFEAS
jgi:hypothetical protein